MKINQKIWKCDHNIYVSAVYNGDKTIYYDFAKSQCEDLVNLNILKYPFKLQSVINVTPDNQVIGNVPINGRLEKDCTCYSEEYEYEGHHYEKVVVIHYYTLSYTKTEATLDMGTEELHIQNVICAYDLGTRTDHLKLGSVFWKVNTQVRCDPSFILNYTPEWHPKLYSMISKLDKTIPSHDQP